MTQQTADVSRVPAAVRQAIRQIVAEELELDVAALSDTADMVEEYDADSLSLITVAARIEKELDITLPRTDLAELTTLEQVFAAVEQHAAGTAG